MQLSKITARAALVGSVALMAVGAHAQSFSDGFEGATLAASGWTTINRSTSPSATGVWRLGTAITDANANPVVLPYAGNQFAVVSYTSTTSTSATAATISNWLLSPLITGLNNGDTFSFFTTTTPGSAYADRMEVRLSTSGSSTNVGTTTTSTGDFSTLLLSINPNLTVPGYPESWTQYTVTLSGLTAPIDGRVAFRYFVTQGGPAGNNSNIIGLDNFVYTAVPEPASWALMMGGAVGLLAWKRRRSAAV
jgi:hypothetical protein